MATNVLVVSASSFYVNLYRYIEENEISDIKVVAVIDPTGEKLGKDLGEIALGRSTSVPVLAPDAIKQSKAVRADVLLLYAPPMIGVDDYARAALDAGQALVNMGMQSTASYAKDFTEKRLPMAGDYAVEQLSPSVTLDSIIKLLEDKGLRVTSSYEIGAGGPELDEAARERRRKDELSLVRNKEAVFMGAVEPIDFMGDRRHYYTWIEAQGPLKSKVQIDLWMKYEETPLLCAPAVQLVRGVAKAREEGSYGPVKDLMGFFKRPLARTRS